jgi:hypothetical protein
MLSGSGQKGNAISCSACGTRSTRIVKIAGVMAGTNPRVSSMRNTVNPLSRFREEAGVPARGAVEAVGKGTWRKRMPPCNGVDRRCDITPPRKRAHFQSVVRDERTRRTASGGHRK